MSDIFNTTMMVLGITIAVAITALILSASASLIVGIWREFRRGMR